MAQKIHNQILFIIISHAIVLIYYYTILNMAIKRYGVLIDFPKATVHSALFNSSEADSYSKTTVTTCRTTEKKAKKKLKQDLHGGTSYIYVSK